MAIAPGLGTAITRAGNAAIQVTSITPPQISNPAIDTTVLSSTWRSSQGTVPDGGEITFSVLFDPSSTTHSGLVTACAAGTVEAYVITQADAGAATWGFNGHITAVSPLELTPDNVGACDVTVKVTGAVTLTP